MTEKKNRRLLPLAAGLMSVALIGAACGGDNGDNGDNGAGGDGGGDGEDQKDLTIGYIDWAENVAISNLYKVELEDRGYDVELSRLDATPLFQGVADDSIDMFQDVWLPTTHESKWDEYKDEVEDLGVWYDEATLNITVPDYVDEIDSIPDLKDNADLVNGEIVGIDGGAGIMEQTEDYAIPNYDLEDSIELTTSSEAAMLADLDKAINDEDPIVVTLWHPHWAYEKYDLKDLEDPDNEMGETEELHTIARTEFKDDFPNLAEAVENFEMDDETLSSLEDAIEDADEGQEEEAVKDWADDHEDLMEDYFGDL